MSQGPTTGPCPFCGKQVPRLAQACRSCGESLEEDSDAPEGSIARWDDRGDEVMPWLIPSGRSAWAIASGYLGLLAFFPLAGFLFGAAAVVTGILALRQVRRTPRLMGRGRAVFGIISGAICSLLYGVMLLGMLGWVVFG
jgi:hypothetical protein